jgi:Zn-dependent M28 family amino/carboxypeptidase
MRNDIHRSTVLAVAAALALAGAVHSSANDAKGTARVGVSQAAGSISAAELMRHIRPLASDAFQGRAPGTRGEDLTVAYLTDQFKALGLEPGNPDGSWVQKVPLVGLTPRPAVSFSVAGTRMELGRADYLARSLRHLPEVVVADSELVFVGYGVVAPEYGWDDFKGADLAGKTLVFLVGDPPVPDPKDPKALDPAMFKGRAMTYYGRWTYKYEVAAQMGAAAAIIVHQTGPAGYPMEALGSWRQENLDIRRGDGNLDHVAVEAWLTHDKARELFAAAGQDLDALEKAAIRKDFKPVPLAAKANLAIQSTLREVDSRNVVARLTGSDPKLKDQVVVYVAHWDHMGRDRTLAGDQVFNGALDNASGTAGLLELARAFAALQPRPRRSIMFLAVTAEEKGLLGSLYYASHPLVPLDRTLAVVNIDGLNPWGRTRDLQIVGYGNSTLDDLAVEAAAAQGRQVTPDAEPEKGSFYRSDHFPFAKLGVPALDPGAGVDIIGKPEGWGAQKRDEYTTRDYHKVSDEVRPGWDLSGAVEDLKLFFDVGYRVAQGEKWPEWKPGTEFRALREQMLRRQ